VSISPLAISFVCGTVCMGAAVFYQDAILGTTSAVLFVSSGYIIGMRSKLNITIAASIGDSSGKGEA